MLGRTRDSQVVRRHQKTARRNCSLEGRWFESNLGRSGYSFNDSARFRDVGPAETPSVNYIVSPVVTTGRFSVAARVLMTAEHDERVDVGRAPIRRYSRDERDRPKHASRRVKCRRIDWTNAEEHRRCRVRKHQVDDPYRRQPEGHPTAPYLTAPREARKPCSTRVRLRFTLSMPAGESVGVTECAGVGRKRGGRERDFACP
jgi:hypothetical protein